MSLCMTKKFAMFLVKILIHKHVLKLKHFQDKIVHLFFFQKEAFKSEGVNINLLINKNVETCFNAKLRKC